MTLERTQDTDIRILKEEQCPSLSNVSTLTYQIGCNEEKKLLLRITHNTGNGKWNGGWVSVADMQELIYEAQSPFSWKVLMPLTIGKSVNTPCFLLAALKNERLIQPLDRQYTSQPAADFQDRMRALIDSSISESKPRKRPKGRAGAAQTG